MPRNHNQDSHPVPAPTQHSAGDFHRYAFSGTYSAGFSDIGGSIIGPILRSFCTGSSYASGRDMLRVLERAYNPSATADEIAAVEAAIDEVASDLASGELRSSSTLPTSPLPDIQVPIERVWVPEDEEI